MGVFATSCAGVSRFLDIVIARGLDGADSISVSSSSIAGSVHGHGSTLSDDIVLKVLSLSPDDLLSMLYRVDSVPKNISSGSMTVEEGCVIDICEVMVTMYGDIFLYRCSTYNLHSTPYRELYG